MDIISNQAAKPQRRIIVETPQLVFLFDVLLAFLGNQREYDRDIIIEEDFGEMAREIEDIVELVVMNIIEHIDVDKIVKLIEDPKTGKLTVEEKGIISLVKRLVKEDKDGFLSILTGGMGLFLSEACKSIVDDLIEQGEFNNFKRIKVKTRKHVLVLC